MRLDTANRSFAALGGASLGMAWLLCGAVACVLVTLIGYRVAEDGIGALTSGSDLWPALAFLGLVGAGAMLGIRSLLEQAVCSVRLGRRVSELDLPLTPEVEEAANGMDLRDRVVLVDSSESFSFTYGALTPRVAVSRGLVEATTRPELEAVLEHERYHVRNLDPLKVLLARALPATFFYLPALREMRARYIAGRELAADRRAVARCGRQPLAGALFKVVRGPQWPELGAAAAIGGPELLDARVAQLETGEEPAVPGLSRLGIGLSLLGGAVLLAAFLATVTAVGGPSAIARETGTGLDPLDIALGVLCVIPWAIGGLAVYAWLSRRARNPA